MRHLMICSLLLLGFNAQAQFKADGSLINNFQMHTISGDTLDAYNLNAQGKHIVIDFSATWCIACWNYHGTHVLEDYYQDYGPNGSIAQDAQVVFFEGDPSTNSNDIIGTGTNTLGDWTMGITHPICNESNPFDVRDKFVVAPSAPIPFPTVVVLCQDSRFFKLSTSTTNSADLRTLIESKCASPNSVTSFENQDLSFSLYPNPTSNELHLDLGPDFSLLEYQIVNATGQQLKRGQIDEQKSALAIDELANGLYFLILSSETSTKSARFIINR